MTTVRNTDTHRRVWPTLNRADGRVLELDPGEEAEVDEGVTGPFLAVVRPAKTDKTDKTEDPTGGK